MSDNKMEESGPLQVDTDLVRELARLVNESDLSEIEVQDGIKRIVVKRKLNAAPAPVYQAAPVHAPAPQAAAPIPVTVETSPADHPGTVRSPMVGTVYLAGEPGAAPFGAIGDRVNEGDTLVIIEAMKVMNPITATRAGVVSRMLVSNAQPVEYDQPLVIVE